MGIHYNNGEKHIEAAVASMRSCDFKKALDYCLLGIDELQQALSLEIKSKSHKDQLTAKISEYITMAEEAKRRLEETKSTKNDNSSSQADFGGKDIKNINSSRKPPKAKKPHKDEDESSSLRKNLMDSVVTETPNVKWSDVAGLESAKEALKEAVLLPLRFPHMFTGKRQPWRGILLYGPSGTGKSYLAKAVATEAKNCTFFSISSSSLMSKWVGESEKNVRNLFEMARDLGEKEDTSSVIFIDEIDSLCSARSDKDSEAVRRIKTELLVQMDGVGKNNSSILVLGATNLPWQLDPAVRRRLERRIYIPLPCEKARLTLLRSNLAQNRHTLSEDDFIRVSRLTDGFSGADISVLVRTALMRPVQVVQNCSYFARMKDKDGIYWQPCQKGDANCKQMTWVELRNERVVEPPVTIDDIMDAVKNTKPTVSNDYLRKYDEFTKQFGLCGE